MFPLKTELSGIKCMCINYLWEILVLLVTVCYRNTVTFRLLFLLKTSWWGPHRPAFQKNSETFSTQIILLICALLLRLVIFIVILNSWGSISYTEMKNLESKLQSLAISQWLTLNLLPFRDFMHWSLDVFFINQTLREMKVSVALAIELPPHILEAYQEQGEDQS